MFNRTKSFNFAKTISAFAARTFSSMPSVAGMEEKYSAIEYGEGIYLFDADGTKYYDMQGDYSSLSK